MSYAYTPKSPQAKSSLCLRVSMWSACVCVWIWAFLPLIPQADVLKEFRSNCISIHIHGCRLKETLCHKNCVGGGGRGAGGHLHISPSLQVNPHFIMVAEPARGRLKTCFWARLRINYIKGEISLQSRLDLLQYHVHVVNACRMIWWSLELKIPYM